jgi:hypothetical protein
MLLLMSRPRSTRGVGIEDSVNAFARYRTVARPTPRNGAMSLAVSVGLHPLRIGEPPERKEEA